VYQFWEARSELQVTTEHTVSLPVLAAAVAKYSKICIISLFMLFER
jgi:hypothetical protein